MDFAVIPLTPEQERFAAEVRAFVAEHVTDEVRERERRTGSAFAEDAYLALAAKGWVMAAWPVAEGGAGLGPIEQRILEVELAAAQYPWVTASMTKKVWGVVARHLEPALAAGLKPEVAAGRVRFCLGYTEPQGGSDIAAARLGAVRDGDDWVLDGTKTLITGARDCQYVFLLTRTDPEVPKHKGMTTFLVPLDSAGIEIEDERMFGGERTNTLRFTGVRLPDRYRLGEAGAGWAVVHAPLDEEHSVGVDTKGLHDLSVGAIYVRPLQRALDTTVRWSLERCAPDGPRPFDSEAVRLRLAEVALDLEVALSTPGPMGRVAGSDVMTRGSAVLVDLLGARALLVEDAEGTLDDGEVERAFRFAHGASLYGGTPEVYRGMIAQGVLGLPKPSFPGSRAFLGDDTPDGSAAGQEQR
ncbi:acyl-CoA dehydrogenase family protein [Streptosporangium sp. NPDC051022]|uniref:acyl-CoA dehydrogenase family protein n=1 Tax=Streptosporangium sp. NPDC051022 TaxID=3155752 RepID=UPI003422CDB0